MSISLSDLRASILVALNDQYGYAYSPSDVDAAILRSVRDVELSLGTNICTQPVITEYGTNIYSMQVNLYKIISVSLNGVPLLMRTQKERATELQSVADAVGRPNRYDHYRARAIRFYPTPDDAYTIDVEGLTLTQSLDGPTLSTIPDSYGLHLLAMRAEAYLRMWRPTVTGNIELAQMLGKDFAAFVEVLAHAGRD